MTSAASLSTDICVVGSGFAGSAVAARLGGRARVILVEAGDPVGRAARFDRLAAGALERVTPTPAHLHTPIAVESNAGWFRQLRGALGGNSNFWTAWMPRPLPSSFHLRARYGVGVDWPLSYDALEPYLCQVEEDLGVAGDETPDQPPRSRPYPLPPFEVSYADRRFAQACAALGRTAHRLPVARTSRPYRGRSACCLRGTCADCPTDARYTCADGYLADATRAGVRIERPLVAERLELGPGGAVARVACLRPDRSRVSITAGRFVLACNPIETVRLLLASRGPGHPQGVGNGHDLVGRYLVDHPTVTCRADSRDPLVIGRAQPTVISRHHEDEPLRGERAGFLLFIGPAAPAPVVGRSLVDRGLYGLELKRALRRAVSHQFVFIAKLEVLPRAENRVLLEEGVRDVLGRPGLRVRFHLGDYEQRAVRAVYDAVDPLAAGMGAQLLDHREELFARGAGAHVLGGARMAARPEDGVVDLDLKVHGVPNLYLAGGAVFPSALGAANPTLTLTALALRLATHLRGAP